MENRWPPDNVKTVSIPLALSRRAMSRPAWTVCQASVAASMLIGRQPIRLPRVPSPGRTPVEDAAGRLASKETRIGPQAVQAVDRLVRPQSWTPVGGSPWRGLISAVVSPVVLVALRYFDAVGPAVLAHHRRILRRPRQRQGVADARRAAVFGASCRCASTYCSATRATTCTPRCRRRSRASPLSNDAVKRSGIHGFWMSIAIFSVLAGPYVSSGSCSTSI